ncbi:ATP-binding protein [Nakamurella deserti]|uniref:ATP-binding protein n=1 Tax=Nakamurella deserti TaxID=2164074 RepID=UPI001478D6CD|nr:LuxR C-terminal-related transcriptional regulator [Nakamurella deserti]
MSETAPDPTAAGVTRREREVLDLVVARLANREIAEALFLSERTVESHVSSLLRKLGGRDRSALLRFAPPPTVPTATAGDAAGSRGLPHVLSSFVGRDRETADVLDLMRRHRLVTLTGPAGAGKTRLAVQLAGSEAIGGPVTMVDLATVRTPDDVERAFADALGVTGDDRRLRSVVRRTAASRPQLLLIDNCEHVVDTTAELVGELLADSPDTRVLATGLGPLRVAGESVYDVPPLPVPSDAAATGWDADDPDGSAVSLFVERARAVDPHLAMTDENRAAVATICRLLDGLPLAIELAAARARYYSPVQLVSLLDDRFALLTDAARPSRHRTLEAALRWSHDLLGDDEKRLLARCAVFPADFDHDTAAQVLILPPLAATDMVRLFPRLLDRSLISRRQGTSGTRYRLLDSVRQFAAGKLAEAGEVQRLQDRHADHFLAAAVTRAADLQGPRQPAAIAWFDEHWSDLRVAVRHSLQRSDHTAAWAFFSGVGLGWEVLGARGEVFDWLRVLLARGLPDGPPGVRAAAGAAVMLSYQDTGHALRVARQGFALARGLPPGPELALAHFGLGWALMYQHGETGIPHLETARDLFAAAGLRWHEALAIDAIGLSTTDLDRSVAFSLRAVEVLTGLGDRVWRASALVQLANRCIRAGVRTEEAQVWLAESERLAIETGNRHGVLHVSAFRAFLDQRRGMAVADRLEELTVEFERIGDKRCAVRCLLGRAREQGSGAERSQLVERAGVLAGEMDDVTLRSAVQAARASA